MASLLLKHMASSWTLQVLHFNRLTMTLTSPAASTYRFLRTLSTAPSSLLWSSARRSPVQSHASLLGRCQTLSCIQQSASMKTKSALKRRCKDCFFVRRRGRLFVYCKTNPRHKQRQGWIVMHSSGLCSNKFNKCNYRYNVLVMFSIFIYLRLPNTF